MTFNHLVAALADRYRLERELGHGGMATVYLAKDVRHDREVAIKVLRPELAAVIGAERFLAEIKTTAHLQHPHILSLFDSGEVDGTVFYVMPFVEGESLRDRLAREKQLPVDEALTIAREVADAAEYAHRHGVIHRDLKPENIMLQGGHALVADFGIALAAAKTGDTRMTETGMSLGTPTYMSPEQAMGERDITARSDVYALGCVLYEMLTGEPPFSGPTAQSVVAKVLTEPPPSARLRRPTVPEGVDAAIATALQKLPADRFKSAAEFGAALAAPALARPRPAERRRLTRIASLADLATVSAIAVALGIALFLLGGRLLGRHGGPPVAFGRGTHVTWNPGLEITPALSPDGRSVAYAAGTLVAMRIFVRPVAEGRSIALTDDSTEMEAAPAWSPDGSRVLFLARGGVASAPAAGGPSRPEIPGTPANPVTSAVWSSDGNRIAFTRNDTLWLSASGGSARPLARLAAADACSWSPDGAFVACAAGNPLYALPGQNLGNQSPSWIVLCRVRDGNVTTVTDSASSNQSPVWSADNRWLYFVSNRFGPRDIFAVPVTTGGRAGGPAVRLTTGLGAHTISLGGTRLAYSLYSLRSSIWSLPIPEHPSISGAGATRLTNSNEYIESFSVSPDGKWLYYDSDLTGNADIFRAPVAGGTPEQLTNDPADDFFPSLSPDGREVVFHSWRGGSRDIYVLPLNGGAVEQLTNSPGQEAMADWSPDGRAIAFNDFDAGGVWIVRRDGQGHWGKPARHWGAGFLPVWSPDGREILFSAGVLEGPLYVLPVDSGAPRLLYDTSAAGAPHAESATWLDPGRIAFVSRDRNGTATIWEVSSKGGVPRFLVRLDPSQVYSRSTIRARHGRFFFSTEDRESDIWTLDVVRP